MEYIYIYILSAPNNTRTHSPLFSRQCWLSSIKLCPQWQGQLLCPTQVNYATGSYMIRLHPPIRSGSTLLYSVSSNNL